MGNNSLRKLISSETRWTDKEAPKHKHIFSVEACVELEQDGRKTYYHVNKCEKCNSFKCIGTSNNCTGFSKDKIDGLPIIKLYRSHKTIGFKGAIIK